MFWFLCLVEMLLVACFQVFFITSEISHIFSHSVFTATLTLTSLLLLLVVIMVVYHVILFVHWCVQGGSSVCQLCLIVCDCLLTYAHCVLRIHHVLHLFTWLVCLSACYFTPLSLFTCFNILFTVIMFWTNQFTISPLHSHTHSTTTTTATTATTTNYNAHTVSLASCYWSTESQWWDISGGHYCVWRLCFLSVFVSLWQLHYVY